MENINIFNHPKLRNYNEEIKKCLDSKLYSQVTITCRQALEYMVNQYVLEFNQSLNMCMTVNEKINGLQSSGVISEDWVKNSSIIRRIANDGGAHDNSSSSGNVIGRGEANMAYDTLLKLENVFLTKMPSVSTKVLQDGFRNKVFEKNGILNELEKNEFIFNSSSHNSKDGKTWYKFNFKIKKLIYECYQLRITNNRVKYCGEDNGYYIFEFNDTEANVLVWLDTNLDKLNKYNSMSDQEAEAIYNDHLKEKQIQEEKERTRAQQEAENKRKEYEKKKKRKTVVVLVLVVIIAIVILRNKYIEKKKADEIQALELIKQNEIDSLKRELLSETSNFDINYVEGSSLMYEYASLGPTILNTNQCGGNWSYMEWLENGKKMFKRKIFYYKPVEILYDEDAIDFIKRIEPIFLEEFVTDGLYEQNQTLDTNNYYYCVVKISIDDSNLAKYVGNIEKEAFTMATCHLDRRDENYWKTLDEKFYGGAFYYRLLKKHELGSGVYPIYAVLKFDKEYTNYDFIYDVSSVNDGGWIPNYYKIEIYKHY